MQSELIITDHVKDRFYERVSYKGDPVKHLKNMFSSGRKLNRFPLNPHNIRFFTRYSNCEFIKLNRHILVTKEDLEGVVAVTVLNWDDKMRECLY